MAVQIAARPDPIAIAGAPSAAQRRNDQSTTREVSGAVAAVEASAAGDRRDHDVAGGVEQRGRRDRPVALAVGDPLRVGAMTRDRVSEPVADPPGHPAAGQGDAERHHRDQGAPDVHTGPVGHQPGQRAHPEAVPRGAVCSRVGEEPAGDSEGQADQQRAGRGGGAGDRGQEHERAAVAQVPLQLPRRRAGAVGHQRGHVSHLRGRRDAVRRCHADVSESALSCRGRYRGTVMARTLPRSHPRSPEGFEAFYKDVRGRLLLQSYALTGDLLAAQRAVRDAMVVAWHHWRKVSRLERARGLRAPAAPGPGRTAAAARAGGPGRRTSTPTPARRWTHSGSSRPPSARCSC